MKSNWLFVWITGIIFLLLLLWYIVSLVKSPIVLYIVIIHCILWLLNYHFTNILTSALLIYPVTDVGAYKLISFLLHYVSACTVKCENVVNTLLSYLIPKTSLLSVRRGFKFKSFFNSMKNITHKKFAMETETREGLYVPSFMFTSLYTIGSLLWQCRLVCV